MRFDSRRLFSVSLAAIAWMTILALVAPAATDSTATDPALFNRLDIDGDGKLTAGEIAKEHHRLFARLSRRGDADSDGSLSREEFLAALIPNRPEKSLEEKQSAELPQADAVRYLLLTMDADGNSDITADEVPADLRPAYEAMLERIDRNDNDVLERMELSRGGPQLARIAARFVGREDINVDAELRKLDRKLGAAARRFEQNRTPMEILRDPQLARELFQRMDSDGDAQLSAKELPEQFRGRPGGLMRRADRNGDGQINEREFLAAAQRLGAWMARQQATPSAEEMRRPEAMESDGQAP